MSSLKRLKKELEDIQQYEGSEYHEKFTPTIIDDNMHKWTISMMGPDKSDYAGQELSLSVDFPEDYPYKPPKIKFLTVNKLKSHPNIHQDGSICVDILKEEWSPILTITKVMVSLMSLLIDKK
jgi:ubiquitin-conjugating enzyme E2 D/E